MPWSCGLGDFGYVVVQGDRGFAGLADLRLVPQKRTRMWTEHKGKNFAQGTMFSQQPIRSLLSKSVGSGRLHLSS